MDFGHTNAKSLILCGPNSNPNPKINLGFGYRDLLFCRSNGLLMDKGLTVTKWVLINRSKLQQMPKNLSAQFVYPSPKVWDFDEKRLHRASVVRDMYNQCLAMQLCVS